MLKELVEKLIHPTFQAPSISQTGKQASQENLQRSNLEEYPKTDQEKGNSQDKEQDTSLKEEPIYNIAIIGKVWLFFANSIMSGEFLSYSDYSRELDDMITSIRSYYDKSTDGDPSNPTPYLHPVLATIHDLCFKLRTLCMLMSIQIEVVKEKESVLAISSPLPPSMEQHQL